jgi:hypothetical protein
MPRQSIEARSAAIYRRGGKRPSPPANLSDEAKKLWREIVEDRPIDYFRPGALYLLEQLCVMTVAARRVSAWLQERLWRRGRGGSVSEILASVRDALPETTAFSWSNGSLQKV